ncbi:MAG: hypothetical protein ACRD43_09945 [Pyrinomonadaceae bacterium]
MMDLVGSLRPSSLEFVTSGGADAEGGEGPILGVTLQGIQLKDNSSGVTKWITFGGVGGGVGVGFPIGGSMSTPDFPSFGSKILKGTTNWGTLEFNDLVGLGQIVVVSASAGPGISGSLIYFNCLTPPPLPPVLFKAALWVEGLCLGIPGVGIMGYMGVWFY